MEQVEVFRFKCFYNPTGEYVVPPQWGTMKAIEATQGVPILDTRRLVSSAELDPNGFYWPLREVATRRRA